MSNKEQALSVSEMLINLATNYAKLEHKVSVLEEQLDSVSKDIVTVDRTLLEKIELLTDDIVMLDERTQDEELAKSVTDAISRKLSKEERL